MWKKSRASRTTFSMPCGAPSGPRVGRRTISTDGSSARSVVAQAQNQPRSDPVWIGAQRDRSVFKAGRAVGPTDVGEGDRATVFLRPGVDVLVEP